MTGFVVSSESKIMIWMIYLCYIINRSCFVFFNAGFSRKQADLMGHCRLHSTHTVSIYYSWRTVSVQCRPVRSLDSPLYTSRCCQIARVAVNNIEMNEWMPGGDTQHRNSLILIDISFIVIYHNLYLKVYDAGFSFKKNKKKHCIDSYKNNASQSSLMIQ